MADRRGATAPRNTFEWFLPEAKGHRHEIVWDVCDRIVNAQSYRQDEFQRNERFYGVSGMLGLTNRTRSTRNYTVQRGQGGSRVSFNVIKSCADAYVAKLTKDKPKTSFVTDGGDDRLQEKAKGLERFCDGKLYELRFYRLCPQFALDTCIYKNGIAKLYITGNGRKRNIAIERVNPCEILVDDGEGLYGKPANMYQEKAMDRRAVMAKWGKTPELKRAIEDAPRVSEGGTTTFTSVADQILVREAWHLPAEDGDGKDGYWCVIIRGATLDEDRWTRTRFPFSILRRVDPLQGWWGAALADDLAGIQREISSLLYNIQRHYRLLGASKVIVPLGFNKNKFDNDIDVLEANLTNGAPYIMCPANIVSPEMYQHLDRLYQKAYELSGINQMSAQSQIPQQVESGKAIQALADVESDRFMTSFRLFEDFVLDVTTQVIELAREISAKQPDFGVKAFDSNSMKRVVFSKNWLDEEEYVLKAYPTNLLADDPVAKMAQVEKMMSAGTIDPDDGARLLDFPDTAAYSSRKNANFNATNRIIDGIMAGEKPIAPDPIMNLSESIQLVRAAYLATIGKEGVDEAVVDNLRTWLTQAQSLLTPPAAPPTPVANMQADQATQALAAQQQAAATPGGAPPPPSPQG